MHNHNIKSLLELEEFIVKKVENFADGIHVHVEKKPESCCCPSCGSTSLKIHDYRHQSIKDAPIRNKPTVVIYRKRRYKCKSCGKQFDESNSFIAKYKRFSKKLITYVREQLSFNISATEIAHSAGISTNIISRMLPLFSVPATHLPRVLCSDEFRGNSGHFKYQVLLLDGETHKIIDVLECRYKHFLCDYFKRFPQFERDKVEYVVSDLWEPYSDIAFTYFRKAKFVADHFHFVRYAVQMVDTIRKKVQKNLPKNERKYFKHSRHLLLSKSSKLSNSDCEKLLFILTNYSEELRIAYKEKELFCSLITSTEPFENKVELLKDWIWRNLNSDIPELVECAKTFQHWFHAIKNSLEVPYSNGPTEGTNNKIKVLKRVTYGMPNFTNFKARILLLFA